MSLVYPSSDKSGVCAPAPDLKLDAFTHQAWKYREQDRVKARTLCQQVIASTHNPVLWAQADVTLSYILWREGQLAEALETIQKALNVVHNHNLLDWLY